MSIPYDAAVLASVAIGAVLAALPLFSAWQRETADLIRANARLRRQNRELLDLLAELAPTTTDTTRGA